MNETRELLRNLEAVFRREQELLGDTLLAGGALPAAGPSQDASPPPPMEATANAPRASAAPRRARPAPAAPAADMLFDTAPVTEPWAGAADLAALNGMICTCLKCPLGATRTKFVFGVGNPKATLMLVGEAPGADEDLQGEPFVGRAGQLLNKILDAIRFRREDVYICNILKCRPPNNRTPAADEVEKCLPYLRKQIQLVRPRVILCLGLTAAQNLLGTTESLTRLRGRELSFEGIPLMVTYHPAALLRNPNWKRPAWEDVQAVRALHDRLAGQPT